MEQHDHAKCPAIEVTIETKQIVPASVAGELLEEIARGFERHARGKGRRDLRLGVRRVDIGSLIMELAVIGAAPGAPSAEVVTRSFLVATGELLRSAQGLAPGTVRKSDARLIDALRDPVADGLADRVILGRRGGAAEAVVDREAVRLIDASRSRPTARSEVRVSRSLPAPDDVLPPPPARRELRGANGTVLDVKGRWYVRLEGEGGVLNPLEPGPGVAVVDEAVYEFDGSWEGRSYRIRTARRIA
ncbi:hypothetical protein [Sphingomonas prati]|uniref:Uncharacterized protein n=1 Tax=Sphingomonas prati TaxID=1843237 RepID=A0A7W9BRL1_9SPHN|nr:hypothetical protein [Sphingomonas prati]MBB5728318.1 hypothetical protein [Sphingomonas prati]GGE74727.1 hypothetical protein GCM10011404_04100 [Sphingomonas prati]